MRRCRSAFVPALVALLLVVTALVAGCSSDPPPPKWQEVTSGSFTSATAERLDLGTLYLTGKVRLAWELSGSSGARAKFELEASHATGAHSSETRGTSVLSWKENFAPRSEAALELTLEPDYYRVTLTQRLPRGVVAGYTGAFTLHTQDLD